MDLKDFTQKVIVDIVQGVSEAKQKTGQNVYFPLALPKDGHTRTIEFDVAVSIENTTDAEGRGDIKVLEFLQAGGGISRITKNSTVSRIKFGVNVWG